MRSIAGDDGVFIGTYLWGMQRRTRQVEPAALTLAVRESWRCWQSGAFSPTSMSLVWAAFYTGAGAMPDLETGHFSTITSTMDGG